MGRSCRSITADIETASCQAIALFIENLARLAQKVNEPGIRRRWVLPRLVPIQYSRQGCGLLRERENEASSKGGGELLRNLENDDLHGAGISLAIKAIAIQARPNERPRELATVVPLPLETSSKIPGCCQNSPQCPESLGETTSRSLVDETSGAESPQALMGWNLLKSLPGGPG